MIPLLVPTTSCRCPNKKYQLCKVEKININIVSFVDLQFFFCDSDLLCKTWLNWFIFYLALFSIIDTVVESQH